MMTSGRLAQDTEITDILFDTPQNVGFSAFGRRVRTWRV